MGISKKKRQEVFNKFGGRCAYTGVLLEEGDWQVDHVLPRSSYVWFQPEDTRVRWGITMDSCDCIENLLPCVTIINHYKRGKDLESFRGYMKTFHVRLGKLPKKTSVPRTRDRIRYMHRIAELFGVSVDKPFSGVFYFETLNS